jgi:sulfur carrier protein ThiS
MCRRRIVTAIALACLVLALLPSESAAATRLYGWVERGGGTVRTGEQTSTTKVQSSYPQATVTVYDAGTTDLSTIYLDSGGVTTKANPFTADVYGYWFFYANAGTKFDVRFSGGGLPSPYTLYDVELLSGVGGSGVTSFNSRTGAVVPKATPPYDYTGSIVTNTPAGNISATTVQAAINELDTEKTTLAAAVAAAPVQSVFGRTGAVVAKTSAPFDYTAAYVTNVPAGNIAAADVQAAINELDTEKVDSTGAANAAPVQSVFGRTGDVVAVAGDYMDLEIDASAPPLVATNVRDALIELYTAISVGAHSHTAADIAFVPYVAGLIAATDVQAAIEEVAAERALSTHAHAASDITSGTLVVARGGTGLATLGAANTVMAVNTGGTANEYKAVSASAPLVVTPGAGTLAFSCPTCASGPGVTSFNGRTGVVVPAASDYTATQTVNDPNTDEGGNISAAEVQAAIDELDLEKSSTSHTHTTYLTTNTSQTTNSGAHKTFSGSQYASALASVTFNTTSTVVDFNSGNVQKLTMTGNITSVRFTNAISGGRYVLLVAQDATGSRTVTNWYVGASGTTSVKWPSSTAPTLSGASKVDIIALVYDGSSMYGSFNTNY